MEFGKLSEPAWLTAREGQAALDDSEVGIRPGTDMDWVWKTGWNGTAGP